MDPLAARRDAKTDEEAATARKPRVATMWLGGCSGCHMSFMDLDERLIELAPKIDLVYSPIVDTKEYPEDVDAALIEGAVANQENLELIKKIRERTRYLCQGAANPENSSGERTCPIREGHVYAVLFRVSCRIHRLPGYTA